MKYYKDKEGDIWRHKDKIWYIYYTENNNWIEIGRDTPAVKWGPYTLITEEEAFLEIL